MRSRPISIGPASSTRWRQSPPPAAGRASNPSEGSFKEQPDDPRDKRRPAHDVPGAPAEAAKCPRVRKARAVTPIESELSTVRIHPDSFVFTLLLGLLSS